MQNFLSRSWYSATIPDFLTADRQGVLGELVARCQGESLLASQRDAWQYQIELLQQCLRGIPGWTFWEFSIPRMGRRVDVVLVSGASIMVLEFKVGSSSYDREAIEQVWDYALDLKNFHETSHAVRIVPILVATDANATSLRAEWIADADQVYRPLLVNSSELREMVQKCIGDIEGESIDGHAWSNGPYKPTPTILEAARALYSRHSVEEIARADAGAKNLARTSNRVEELALHAHREKKKVICFVTGVPGAGKTLVGLDVANRRREYEAHAVFLSGNGPLVAVLREALARDEHRRRKSHGEKARIGKIRESVKAFIQNVHHFRDEALIDSQRAPSDHIAIFDEAQRAWNREQTASFMTRKKKVRNFNKSEPEFLLEYMDRHSDWAMVVCLVGGGQEINTGEAGIDAWLEAVRDRFTDWEVYISSRLTESEYAAGHAMEYFSQRSNAFFDDDLHLSVSMRSFRAENVSTFVKALLDGESKLAREYYEQLHGRYPLLITRDLARAKDWVRRNARGSERFGLVSSSKAMRLKPHSIDIRVAVDPVLWFLNGRDDTRSSFYLEDVATEFHVQGLELDWTCVAWDGDLRWRGKSWSYHDFRGDRWENISKPDRRKYLRNAYRVLLTRARQGMVIFVPHGDEADPTRTPEFYDATYDYLRSAGVREL